jgi:hypothetical protein
VFKLKEGKLNKVFVLSFKGLKLEVIYRVEIQGNFCVVCSKESKQ